MKIKKTVFVEEDPSNTCRNYPNPDFASYKDCDSKYLREKVKEIDPDLNPPWLIEDLHYVTLSITFITSTLIFYKNTLFVYLS